MPRFFIIVFVIYFIAALYGFLGFRNLVKNGWLQALYILLFLSAFVNLLVQFYDYDRSVPMTKLQSVSGGVFFAFFAFAFLSGAVLMVEDVIRVAIWTVRKVSSALTSSSGDHMPSRRRFVSQLAMGVAAIPFASLLYGMYRGKYNYQVFKYVLHFDDLPDAFDGYRITQISDIHSGSFDNKEKVAYGIDLINEQRGDLILFTGDLVNNRADEMDRWISQFSRLCAEDGVYSVLGNHDYGDYYEWETVEAKEANLARLKEIQREMGFDLLLNEHRYIRKGNEQIALIGVENWGAGRFKKAGDLNKAVQDIDNRDFKILMSHDPSHWEEQVIPHNNRFHLTLSGHTHGMQFGVEIPGWLKWSPVKWRYKQWAGLYEQMGQYINVNRGFGFIGYPGRVGIYPEITVIELRKGPKMA